MPPTDRNDILDGTGGADVIDGLAGADLINGAAGSDTLSGGDGHDTINGGDGDDVIYGHSAVDVDPASGRIAVTKVGDGIAGAVFATFAPGDPGILYVVAKDGDIIRLNTTTGAKTTFMDLPSNVIGLGGEGGLLGLAFAPNYAASGKFYVHVTNPAGDIEVREYTRSASNPLVADISTARTLITIPHQGTFNHYGGFVGFSPVDGFLYVSVGDGGGGGDPNNNAQNLNSLLGKILRIDVTSDGFPSDPTRNYAIPASNPYASGGGAPEIWASGLRNPWRASFDTNGDLYIADVGQERLEEINYQQSGVGGRNYGWRIMEGSLPYNPVPNPPALTGPTYEFDHSVGISVIGGYVYHGPSPGLQGAYIFSDYNAQPYLSLRIVDGQVVDAIDRRAQIVPPVGGLPTFGTTSFGVDGAGRLYFMTFAGAVYSFDPTAAAGDGSDSIHGDAGADRIYGGAGNDVLWGDAGGDQLFGGDGADVLIGGTGADTHAGAAGDDSYVVDDPGDVVTELANEGYDGVSASLSFTLPTNVEQLNLLAGAVNGYGNTAVNAIFGNSAANYLNGLGGDDYIAGGGGADIIDGSTGADIMDGGLGDDSYNLDNVADVVRENASEGWDAIYATLSYTLNGNFEQLNLQGGAVNGYGNSLTNAIFGNDAANYLNGLGGDDYIAGGGGADIIDGSTGSDIMDGGLGDDSYNIDVPSDVARENASEGWDAIYTTFSYTLPTNFEQLNLQTGAVNGYGNGAINAIFGNDAANYLNGLGGDDYIAGGGGNDIIEGGVGADTMDGGLGDDSYNIDTAFDNPRENANEGWDAVYSSISYTLTTNFEQLNLQGSAVSGTGNARANALFGNGLANTLNGLAGNDSLFGGAGNDTFVFQPGTGQDVISDFVAGGTDDRIDLSAYAGTGVTYTLTQNGANAAFTFSNGDFILLVGVTAANLVQSGDYWL